MKFLATCAAVVLLSFGQAADGEDDLDRLLSQLQRFKLTQPWQALADGPDHLRRNRGRAAYLRGLLAGGDQQMKQRIVRHYTELVDSGDEMPQAADRLDRVEGQAYRQTLRFDVLGLLVELASDGRQHWRFPIARRKDAYYSRAEGRAQLFEVLLPEGYDPQVKAPLFVQVFGGDLRPTKQRPFIRVRPSARGVWGYRTISRYDVLRTIEHMQRAYAVDADRIYLTGTSAGATGAMHVAALRQDLFAGAVPLVAFGNDLPLENFINLPIRCEHGANDWTSSIGNVRVQFQRLAGLEARDAVLNEHPTAGHGVRVPPSQTMDWLFALRREARPRRIVHTCEHPRDGKERWLKIDAMVDPHQVARVEAHMEAGAGGERARLTTRNVRSLLLDVAAAGLDPRQPVSVDGTSIRLGDARPVQLDKAEDGWRLRAVDRSAPATRPYAAGAAANLFQGEPLVVVYGTEGDDSEDQFLRQAAGVLARSGGPTFKPAGVRFPVRSDQQLSAEEAENCNLLLIGSPRTNTYLRQIAGKLPIHLEGDELDAGDREPLSLAGAVLGFHFHNPRHPRRLIYVVSPHLALSQRPAFLRNPRLFLGGSEGFKMIDQPDLLVRGADLRIRREMQLGADWEFLDIDGADQRMPPKYADRVHLATAHLRVMQRAAKADLALWWGPEDKGAFGGYDFNWLTEFDPETYTLADYRVRRREAECLTATLTGEELQDIHRRWILTNEIVTWPALSADTVAALKPTDRRRIVIPMDLVVKLGTRRRTLSDVAPAPPLMPEQIARECFEQ